MSREDWSEFIPLVLTVLLAVCLTAWVSILSHRIERLADVVQRAEVIKACDKAYRDAFRRDPALDSTLVRIVVEGTPQCAELSWYPGKVD